MNHTMNIESKSESVGRLIAVAIGWFLVALLTGFIPMVVLFSIRNEKIAHVLFILTVSAVLLVASVIRGRIVGDGRIRTGLGDKSISRPLIVAALTVTVVSYAALLHWNYYRIHPDFPTWLFKENPWLVRENPWLALFMIFYAALLAPLAEELFFRGWLWTGLLRHWGVLKTALLTSVPWIALHLPRDIADFEVLVPMAIVLSIARHVAQSVRAPIMLHAIYNLVAVTVPWVML